MKKIVISKKSSIIGPIFVIMLFLIGLFFVYYLQFNIDEVASKRGGYYYVFGKKFGFKITICFIFINYFSFIMFKSIYPAMKQLIKSEKYCLYIEENYLFFNDEKLFPVSEIHKVEYVLVQNFKNFSHKLYIYPLCGKPFWCYYIFNKKPNQLVKEIEAIAKQAREEKYN
jgi:hypothetical protein